MSSGRSWTGIFHNKRKNGELFWESAHISPIKDFNGEITHYIAVKEDITEKVKNEEQLTRYREHLEEMVEERTAQLNTQNEFLRSLIDTIPNPIFVKDTEGNYTDVNPAFEKFYGKKKEYLIGKKLDVVLDGEAMEIALETDAQLMKKRGIVNYETYFTSGEGKKMAVLVYKASFGAQDNKPEGIVGIFFDISLRKELEEKTIQALNKEKELNEMKTNFISMASHEFRTPLTTILASADLVEMYYNKWSEEKVINHVKKIQDSVNYMTSLLDDVLTLSRADRGKIKFSPSKQNLKELCSHLMNEIQYQTLPGHDLMLDYKLKDEILNVDNKLLTQILNNLLSNAVKFSPEGGKILLEVTQKDDKIQFIVKDEGLGIDKSDLKNIFEPFFRGKNVTEIHGSGLGLNIVRNAVELHGGDISIESELDKGTKI
ncbi:MAG: PAS domain S-box protein, partial [Ignavibacteria bacterium]|nr:PAS domain S-box protein [Ignavibacteria bacterium]